MILVGDCLDHLRQMEPNSIDSLITDPPAGIGFMGKDWDKDRGGRVAWITWMASILSECLRVMKPGAHGLVWALPRTSHWTATALEDAGFEIRDVVTHLFGTGFPKSLDVSKALDKAAGAEREITGPKSTYRKPQTPNGWDCSKRAEFETLAATDAARQWQGWGTALKPAAEFWWLVRKPCSEKTVAANVLKWGTGAINVDGCRIAHAEVLVRPPLSTNKHEGYQRPWNSDPDAREEMAARKAESADKAQNLGRFPANLVLDEEAAEMLDEQVGHLSGAGNKIGSKKKAGTAFGSEQTQINIKYDNGGVASRFFYIAKASKTDRGPDNNHPTVKSTKLMSYLVRLITPSSGTVLDPFMGSGSTGVAAIQGSFKFIGVEKDSEYASIAEMRLKNAL